jgi:hypothetical protein
MEKKKDRLRYAGYRMLDDGRSVHAWVQPTILTEFHGLDLKSACKLGSNARLKRTWSAAR